LRRAFGQSTERLFEGARRDPAIGGALVPGWEANLDNRVIHWFKHYCEPLRHGVELALMLRQPIDTEKLCTEVVASRSGRVWAFVLELLRRWRAQSGVDPTTDADRAFVRQPRVARVLDACSRLEGGRSPFKVAALMLPPSQRARLALQVALPNRQELLRMSGHASAGPVRLLSLRVKRAAKAARGVLRGK
jgi:hypothetical protein